jgi:hypothetical protein
MAIVIEANYSKKLGLPAYSSHSYSVSPSSLACETALLKIAIALTSHFNADRISVPNLEPNDLAVVLSLRVADVRILLGADLEEVGCAGLGWQAVVADFADEGRYKGFKFLTTVPRMDSISRFGIRC